jgi:hypothetical protein
MRSFSARASMGAMTPALARLFHHRCALVVTVALGVALGLSTLWIGFYTDDYTFLAFLETPGHKHPSTFDLYDFVHGRADIPALLTRGFPWWLDPDLKLRFFRPISSALFLVDHATFGHAPLGYHVHSLLWFALFLAGVAFLFRLVLEPPLLIWCSLLFALNAAHNEPVAWPSSRHLLVACTPAIWGLVAHVAYRERGFRPGRWLSVLGLFVGLLGGEAALGVALFWAAYELYGAPGTSTLGAKLVRVTLPGSIMLAYLVAYKIGDYGSAHNAAYFEPLSDPSGFLAAAAQRIPIMLGEMFLGLPSALGAVLAPPPFVAVGMLATLLIAGLFFAIRNVVPQEEKRAVRWLTVGAMASLAISVGGFPGSRLLLTPSIGGCAIVGTILCYGWKTLGMSSVLVNARRSGWVLLFAVHVVLAPLMFLGNSGMLTKFGADTKQIDLSLDGVLPEPGFAPARPPSVFVVAASDPLAGLYVAAARAVRAPGTISGWSILSMARATHDIRRTDDRTLIIAADHPMLRGAFEGVFCDPTRNPLTVGHRVALPEATVTVLSVQEGFPTAIEVHFVASLDDDRFRLLAWQEGKLLPLRVAIGDHAVIPWTPGPTGFF